MKITFKSEDRSKNINLHFPLFFFKTKLFCKAAIKYSHIDGDLISLQKQIKGAYKLLKKYIKENGHFKMVEVFGNNGDIVIIQV